MRRWHPSAWERTGTDSRWPRKRLVGSPSSLGLLFPPIGRIQKRRRELQSCVFVLVCARSSVCLFVLCFRKVRSLPTWQRGATVGVSFLEQKGDFYSAHGDLGEGSEPGRESTLAQPRLQNYTGSLLFSPAPGTTSLLPAACSFLRGGF